jgi:cytochrome b6-f complex iron-sulfur subunit
MPKKTPEEIQAQREAWLARKAARAAGQDVPPQPASAELASTTAAEVVAEVSPEAEASPQPIVEVAAPEPVAVQEASPRLPPQAPAAKRTPEEIRAQREAFLAAKAAKAAGVAAPPPAPKPAEEVSTLAPTPVAQPVEAAIPAPKPRATEPAAPKSAPAKEAAVEKADPNLTRREFLNYAWLASIALLTVQGIGLTLWFAFPNFKEGQFGGKFPIGPAQDAVPPVNSDPKAYVDGKFWLVNVDEQDADGQPQKGVLALYKVCVHLGCLYDWVPMTHRFECPCHGSKYQLWGDYIGGPARRSLDRFVIQAVAPDGRVVAETDAEGNPLVIEGDVNLVVDTGQRILGQPIVTPA